MPKLIEPINYPGIKAVEKDIDFYKEKFCTESVIAFRNATISFEEQDDLFGLLGEHIGFHPGGRYTEDHSRIKDHLTKDDYLLTWHVEHAYWDNPICAASWYMHTFKENPENGRTAFYPMQKMFDELKPEWQELALGAYIEAEQDKAAQRLFDLFWRDEWNEGDVHITHRPIAVEHFVTKKPVMRVGNLGNRPNRYDHLHKINNINGREATIEEQKMYLEMHHYISNKINTPIQETDDSHIVHEWRENDILIPDLFVMAHTALGGFDSAKRDFRGIWGNINDTTTFKSDMPL